MARSTFLILWKFRAKKSLLSQFEDAYGPDGEWAQLFRKGKGYVGTELYKDANGTFLTIDEWASQDAYEKFKLDFAHEYSAFDAKFEGLTEEEIYIGSTTRILP